MWSCCAAGTQQQSQSGKNVGSFTVAQHRNLSEVATFCVCRRTWCLKYSAFTEKLPTRAFLVALEEDEEIEAQLSQGVNVRTSLAGCFHERDYSQECWEGSTRLGWVGHVRWHASLIPMSRMDLKTLSSMQSLGAGVHQVQGRERAAAQRQGGGVLW